MPTGVFIRTQALKEKIARGMKTYLREHPEALVRTQELKEQISRGVKKYQREHPQALAQWIENYRQYCTKHPHLTEEHKEKISKTEMEYYRTHTSSKKGKPASKEAILKTAVANKLLFATDLEFRRKRFESLEKCWKARDASWADPVKRRKRVEAICRASVKASRKRPTKIEERIINIIAKHHLPYKYVGDGNFILDGKNPDFINVNGEKKLLDIFGDYWHRGGLEEAQQRSMCFAEYGFKDLVIWESELKTTSDKQVADTIRKF